MRLAPLIEVHELNDGGVLFEDANVRVTATLVDHPPVVPSLAYRFDSSDRSIVISGDTRMSDNLIALSRDADVLVHEVYFDEAAVERSSRASATLHGSRRASCRITHPRPTRVEWRERPV